MFNSCDYSKKILLLLNALQLLIDVHRDIDVVETKSLSVEYIL
jgi:hypothetical protein